MINLFFFSCGHAQVHWNRVHVNEVFRVYYQRGRQPQAEVSHGIFFKIIKNKNFAQIVSLKVAFFQKVLMHLSFPQTYEPFIFLSMKILIFLTEIFLEIEDVFKIDSLEACKGKKATVGWLTKP